MWTVTTRTRQLILDFEQTIEASNDISKVVKDFLKAWITPLKDGTTHDRKMLVYLMYMTERLVLMKQVLKHTGSIYFHCDPTASHYIKIIMDGIFGRENFRNEIIWHYKTGGISKKWFGKKHDVILFYSMTNDYFFSTQKEKSYTKSSSRKAGIVNYGKGKAEFYEDKTGVYNVVNMRDVWDISYINSQSKQRIGYPTQKPLEILERIIRASCPDEGVVLDPFCGCGTSTYSAILNNKRWIGVDISSNATDTIKSRIEKLSVFENKDYQFIDGSPETKDEYLKLNAFQKQDWLIDKVGGFSNARKSGDGGVDGEMTIHLKEEKKKDLWGKMVFSVKTGKQCKPEFVRELVGTMDVHNAIMGGLILEADPSDAMQRTAQNKGQIEYSIRKDMPPVLYDKVQIMTVDELLDGHRFNTPPTLKEVKLYKSKQTKLEL